MGDTTELLTVESIRNCVYTIRGQQVMLDSDLAHIYGYELKAMNQQVKRNIERFPEDFMFQLKQEEIPSDYLKSQFVTLNESGNKRGMHIKKMPYAFTEQLYSRQRYRDLSEQQKQARRERVFLPMTHQEK